MLLQWRAGLRVSEGPGPSGRRPVTGLGPAHHPGAGGEGGAAAGSCRYTPSCRLALTAVLQFADVPKGDGIIGVSRSTAWRWVQSAVRPGLGVGGFARLAAGSGTHTFRHSYARHLLLHARTDQLPVPVAWPPVHQHDAGVPRVGAGPGRTIGVGAITMADAAVNVDWGEHPGGAQSRRNSTKRCRSRVGLCPRGWRLWGRSAFLWVNVWYETKDDYLPARVVASRNDRIGASFFRVRELTGSEEESPADRVIDEGQITVFGVMPRTDGPGVVPVATVPGRESLTAMMEMVMMRRSNGNVECHHWNPDIIHSTLPIISGAVSVEVRPVETGYIPPVDDADGVSSFLLMRRAGGWSAWRVLADSTLEVTYWQVYPRYDPEGWRYRWELQVDRVPASIQSSWYCQ